MDAELQQKQQRFRSDWIIGFFSTSILRSIRASDELSQYWLLCGQGADGVAGGASETLHQWAVATGHVLFLGQTLRLMMRIFALCSRGAEGGAAGHAAEFWRQPLPG